MQLNDFDGAFNGVLAYRESLAVSMQEFSVLVEQMYTNINGEECKANFGVYNECEFALTDGSNSIDINFKGQTTNDISFSVGLTYLQSFWSMSVLMGVFRFCGFTGDFTIKTDTYVYDKTDYLGLIAIEYAKILLHIIMSDECSNTGVVPIPANNVAAKLFTTGRIELLGLDTAGGTYDLTQLFDLYGYKFVYNGSVQGVSINDSGILTYPALTESIDLDVGFLFQSGSDTLGQFVLRLSPEA